MTPPPPHPPPWDSPHQPFLISTQVLGLHYSPLQVSLKCHLNLSILLVFLSFFLKNLLNYTHLLKTITSVPMTSLLSIYSNNNTIVNIFNSFILHKMFHLLKPQIPSCSTKIITRKCYILSMSTSGNFPNYFFRGLIHV